MAKLGLTRRKLRKQGFGLILILGFAAILAVFTAGIGAQAASNLRGVQLRGETDRAYYASYTGVQCTVSCLREPPVDPSNPSYDWLLMDRALTIDLRDGSQAIARLFHNIPTYPGAEAQAPDGTKIPKDHFYIISMGVVDGVYDNGDLVSGTKFETNVMGASLAASFPTLPHAAFATDTTTAAGLKVYGTIDHFDSRVLPYTLSDMNCSYPEASVATDSIVAGGVDLGPNCAIDGHVMLGVGTPSSELTTLLTNEASDSVVSSSSPHTFEPTGFSMGGNGSAVVNGNITTQGAARSKIEMKVPTDLAGTFDSSDTVTSTRNLIEGKTYLQEGDLLVDGGTINVVDDNLDGKTEDVLLLVQGSVTIRGSGSRVNDGKSPRTVKIYSMGTGGTSTSGTDAGGNPIAITSLTMDSAAKAYCLIAGEHMNTTIKGNSQLWGAVLGRTIELELGSAIHYDVALRDPRLMADIYGYTVLSTSSSAGAGSELRVSQISPAPVAAAAPAAPTAPAAPAVGPAPAAPAPAPAPAGGCGCGCGCGGGSMMLGLKMAEAAAN